MLISMLLFHPLKGDPLPRVKFIENRQQWPDEVYFAAEVPGGKLFLEQNKLTYAFYDASQFQEYQNRRHAHQHTHTVKDDQHVANPKVRNGEEDRQEVLNWHAFQVTFLDARSDTRLTGRDHWTGNYNYIQGNDPQKWASGAKAYRYVEYKQLYKGINLKIYSEDHHIKYDLIVEPDGNPKDIRLKYEGLEDFTLQHGYLRLKTSVNELHELKPYAYQVLDGKKKEVACQFVLKDNMVKFRFPEGYARDKTLVIDPLVIFSVYSGATYDNWGNTATFDEEGNLYSGGIVSTAGVRNSYPVTTGAYQTSLAGGSWDIGIMKFDSAGSQLLYATFLGGNNSETPQSLVVNNAGELLILGTTSSTDFPVTNGSRFNGGRGFEPLGGVPYSNGSDIFIAKLSGDGSTLMAGTYLGGSDNDGINFISGEFDSPDMVPSPLAKNYGDQFRSDIIIDGEDNVYVASNTRSPDFPVVGTGSIYGGGLLDALLVKLTPDLAEIIWSRFLGGSGTDAAYSLKLDLENNVFIAGGTESDDFPGINGLKTSYSGRIDGWVAMVSADGSGIVNATYTGTGEYDQTYFVDINSDEEIYLFGQTQGNYPVQGDVFQEEDGGQFIHKLSYDLKTTLFSTVFGSGGNSPDISPTAFLVNECNNLFLAGWGGRVNAETSGFGPFAVDRGLIGGDTFGLRVSDNAFQSNTSGSDFYLMVLNEDASGFLYGTFLGGTQSATHVDGGTSRFDKRGIVYHAVCAGCGGFSDFPSVNAPSEHATNNSRTNGGCNNAAFKFDLASLNAGLQTNSVALDNPGLNEVCFPEPIVFQNLSNGGESYIWDFGDGTTTQTDDTSSVIHEYQQAGVYVVTLTAVNEETCKGTDIATTIITVNDPQFKVADDGSICEGTDYQLFAEGANEYFWVSQDSTFTSTSPNPVVFPTETTQYFVSMVAAGGCGLVDSVLVTVIPRPSLNYDIIKSYDCWSRPQIRLIYTEDSIYTYQWDMGDGTSGNENNVTHNYAEDGTYEVSITANNPFCVYQETRTINVFTLKIPNVFTPGNNDEVNDAFYIQSDLPVSLKVINRWGRVVFEQDDYQNDWMAEEISPGVYYYQAEVEQEATCKGWLHILK